MNIFTKGELLKLTVPVKLDTSDIQHQILYETLTKVNEACNFIAEKSFEAKIFRQFDIHKSFYYAAREVSNLSSQVIIRCISKVANSYKLNKKTQPKFKSIGAIAFDSRILTIKSDKQLISIWTPLGRIKINYICGEHQKSLLKFQKGECDLILKNKQFYLYCPCDIPEDTPIESLGILGVDLGIKNIATTSLGDNYSGARLNSLRKQHAKLRAKLQAKGTKSAKCLLKKRSKKERRFATDVNHVISKKIVAIAKHTKSTIALEKLKGIGKRTRVRKQQRATFSNWSFYQLQQFIEYKAKLSGITVVYVKPNNTSRECPECGNIEKGNRKSRDEFKCKSCGLAGPADYIAAINIASRAVVNQPNVVVRTNYKPPTKVGGN